MYWERRQVGKVNELTIREIFSDLCIRENNNSVAVTCHKFVAVARVSRARSIKLTQHRNVFLCVRVDAK